MSVAITCLFIRSGGSVLLTTLYHAVFNSWSWAIVPAQNGEQLVAGAAVLMTILAVFLVRRYGSNLALAPGDPAPRPGR